LFHAVIWLAYNGSAIRVFVVLSCAEDADAWRHFKNDGCECILATGYPGAGVLF
jgi:hypothetical protein